MSKTYDYYADNRLRFSSDLVDHKFDRFYSYDHANRLKEAFSGAEARFEPPTNDRPYRQTYDYDAMGHLTERTFQRWLVNMSSSDSYTNNRHAQVGALWQYDADGNLLQMPATGYTYDAAGRVDTVWAGSASTLSLDGDGQQVKTVEVTYDPEPQTDVTSTKYYVRSTVLRGEVLTELEPANTHSRSFVYAGGVVLATQESYGGPGFVWWEHRDPSNASYRTTATGNPPGDQAELDPVGANAGLTDGSTQSIPDQGSLAPYPNFSSGNSIGTTYSMDGIRIPVDEFMQTINQLFHGQLGIAEALAKSSSRIAGYRSTGVSWGNRFTEVRGADGQLLSRHMRFDPDLVTVSFSTDSTIYGSGSLDLLAEPQNSSDLWKQASRAFVNTVTLAQKDACRRFIENLAFAAFQQVAGGSLSPEDADFICKNNASLDAFLDKLGTADWKIVDTPNENRALANERTQTIAFYKDFFAQHYNFISPQADE